MDAAGVAFAVPAFMVIEGDFASLVQEVRFPQTSLNLLDAVGPDPRVLTHDGGFFLVQRPGLQQHMIGDPDLADVVQSGADSDRLGECHRHQIVQLRVPTCCQGQLRRVCGDAFQVLARVGIAGFGQLRQSKDDGIAGSDQFLSLEVRLFSRDAFLSFVSTEQSPNQDPGDRGLQPEGPDEHVDSQQNRLQCGDGTSGTILSQDHLLPRVCDEAGRQAGSLSNEQHQQEAGFAHEYSWGRRGVRTQPYAKNSG